jgi:oxygen-independent coproporphyrinogen-3 oxidase
MRCGFCNLFTTANPRADVSDGYLRALRRQAERVCDAVGPARYTRMAVGGGTPTYLNAAQLEQVFCLVEELFNIDGQSVPISVETSPRTAELDRLRVLREHGVSRVSIGVQSFVDEEVNASGRAQKEPWVHTAIGRMRDLGFPTLNLDLIYGLPGQTVQSWLESLESALQWRPEELYLYPLYVRPLTGLNRWGRQPEDKLRLDCYREARQFLLSAGYDQVSMRMFQRLAPAQDHSAGPVYCCQEDGMVGLGCGARSYTRSLHYSSEYAVGAAGVREIIADYIVKPDHGFDVADYGCELDESEQKRRWVIKSLLRAQGIELEAYAHHFDSDPRRDLPELRDLQDAGLIEMRGDSLCPTAAGLERSDAIGPYLHSAATHERMDAYALR